LANYPGDDVRGEAVSSDDFGLPEKAYYTLLARRLRGEGNSKAWKAEATIINRSRKKKPKLLLASLDRIVQADEEGFRGALIECLRYHVKRQFPKRGLANKLDLDASILYHAALRAGLRVDALASYRDYLVILKEGE